MYIYTYVLYRFGDSSQGPLQIPEGYKYEGINTIFLNISTRI